MEKQEKINTFLKSLKQIFSENTTCHAAFRSVGGWGVSFSNNKFMPEDFVHKIDRFLGEQCADDPSLNPLKDLFKKAVWEMDHWQSYPVDELCSGVKENRLGVLKEIKEKRKIWRKRSFHDGFLRKLKRV